MKKIITILLVIISMALYSQTEYYVNIYGDNTGKEDVGAVLTSAIAAGETAFRFPPGRYKITTDVIMPSYAVLIIDRGAIIDAQDTITGVWTSVEAGDYQIFTRGSKLDGTWEVDKVMFTWFGALGNTNNVSRELAAAAAFTSKTRGKTLTLTRSYVLESNATLPSGIYLDFRAGAMFTGGKTLTGDTLFIQSPIGKSVTDDVSFTGTYSTNKVESYIKYDEAGKVYLDNASTPDSTEALFYLNYTNDLVRINGDITLSGNIYFGSVWSNVFFPAHALRPTTDKAPKYDTVAEAWLLAVEKEERIAGSFQFPSNTVAGDSLLLYIVYELIGAPDTVKFNVGYHMSNFDALGFNQEYDIYTTVSNYILSYQTPSQHQIAALIISPSTQRPNYFIDFEVRRFKDYGPQQDILVKGVGLLFKIDRYTGSLPFDVSNIQPGIYAK